MKLVIDASVAFKWLLPDARIEPDLKEALGLLESVQAGRMTVLAPVHWKLEVLGVVARHGVQAIRPCLEFFDSLPHTVVDSAIVTERGAQLAATLKHHIFDTIYHAVALETGSTLVTVDDRYFNTARHVGSIKMLWQIES